MGRMTSMEWPVVSALVTPERILAYADLTEDWNPIHLDPAFAATTPFGQPIAHGTMTLALVWELLDAVFPSETWNKPETGLCPEGPESRGAPETSWREQELHVRFVAPVPVGAQLSATGVTTEDGDHLITVSVADGGKVLEARLERVTP